MRASQLAHWRDALVSRLITSICLIVILLGTVVALAEVLITQQEAMLPDDRVRERDVIRGPTVVAVSPSPRGGAETSPLHFRIKFSSHGGAAIDIDSVKITYLKIPHIDLTSRLRPFIMQDGIDMPAAEVPGGTHTVRIEVRDTVGRVWRTLLTFSVLNLKP
jgi:hypothetical protein